MFYRVSQKNLCGLQRKKEWYLVVLAHPNATLDGVGVALKVKARQSNEDIAAIYLAGYVVIALSAFHLESNAYAI